MEKVVSVYEAKTQLSRLLELVANGEVVTITNRGKPVATLNPITSTNEIKFGFLKEQFPNFPSYTEAEWEESDLSVQALFGDDD